MGAPDRTSILALLILEVAAVCCPARTAAEGPPQAPATCRRPEQILDELAAALRDGEPEGSCAWSKELDPSFRNWQVGGSENLPVIAAAVALVGGTGTDRRGWLPWWHTFLAAQLDGEGQALPRRLRYFKGSEPFSNTYDPATTAAILAVRHWAATTGGGTGQAGEVGRLARRYVRATLAAYALAAGCCPVRTGFRNGPEEPIPGFQQRGGGRSFYEGPYIALAGARSNALHWRLDQRGALFSRAAGLPYAGPAGKAEEPELKAVLDALEARWDEDRGESVYGLTAAERRDLRALVADATLPPGLNDLLRGIGTVVRFDFLAWDGVRATSMSSNPNRNTQATYAVGYFRDPRLTAHGREAVFLYPWEDSRTGIQTGHSTLRLQHGLIEASNKPGSAQHPLRKVTMAIPKERPIYHVILSGDRRPRIETPAAAR